MATLTLDRERTLRYTWAGIKRLQKEHGINFLRLVTEDEEWYLDPVKFSAVLWCGLVSDDPALTIDAMDEQITLPRLTAITTAMLEAVADALQEGEQRANPPTTSTA
jgi:hypothetical protein